MPHGIKPEWASLPRRRCKNCPAIFKPVKPSQDFCSANCRKEFHKHGGAFVKLKAYVVQEIKKRIRELSPADETRIAALEKRIEQIEERFEKLTGAFR